MREINNQQTTPNRHCIEVSFYVFHWCLAALSALHKKKKNNICKSEEPSLPSMITNKTINLCAQLRTKCARYSERKRAQNAYRSTLKERSVWRMGKARALCFHS